MGLQAQSVVQLSSFSEEFIFNSLDPLVPEIGTVSLSTVSVTTTPSFGSDGVVPLPSAVVITDTSTATQLSVTLSGNYGLAIALDDLYRTVTFPQGVLSLSSIIREFTSFEDLENSQFSHLTDFLPQDWSYKTFVYNFITTINGVASSRTITQEVYPDMNRHVPRVTSIVAREIIS